MSEASSRKKNMRAVVVQLMSAYVSLWISCTTTTKWPNLFFFPLLGQRRRSPFSLETVTKASFKPLPLSAQSRWGRVWAWRSRWTRGRWARWCPCTVPADGVSPHDIDETFWNGFLSVIHSRHGKSYLLYFYNRTLTLNWVLPLGIAQDWSTSNISTA